MHSYEQDVLDMQEAVRELSGNRSERELCKEEKLLPPLREFKNIHVVAEHMFLGVQQIDLQIPLVYTQQDVDRIKPVPCGETQTCKAIKWDEALNPVLITIVIVNILMFAILGMITFLPRLNVL
ncbi:hypothetical protein GUITHDRAFT_155196 [Guillardia theta CCMP2712]|uniref:Uncharacterized protein n=2 Tax=Guillardia theta TaxID=55529 RepID=L1IK04_GUITC|nr:hypothetical protein GUITHDRAFT_155196 [Guillardia theta CCMP2712]EKX36571.1 hypothetical protein GUITHDRAFT_155196 [Guillardia theta CCMP2712]|eukprot:XP_005823551.1 hypothetical protein GUITHDRAFT_155196 [Guillardia theta CCMP2712]